MPEDKNDIELRSDEIQEILTKVPHRILRWGNGIFIALLLLLLSITWFVKYPDVVVAEATITTVIPPQKEFAKTSGKLQKIFVDNNELVTKEQPLAVIENSANYNDVFILQRIVDTIQVNHKSFSFPIDELPILFLGDIETQYAIFENSYIRYLMNKGLQPFSNDALANEFSLSELNNRLVSLRAQKKLNKTELEYKMKDLERNKLLFDERVISEQTYERKKLDFLQAERSFESMSISISQLKESINNAQKAARSIEINRTREELTLLKSVIQSFNQLKKSIKDWELRYVLQSQIDGNVLFFDFWNSNQTVIQGELVFTIVPSENSSFLVKLKLPAKNAGKIKVGQRVNIKMELYPDTEFGVLVGEVDKIPIIPNKEGFYLMDVILPEKLVTSYNKEIEFKQEMRGMAEIITEDLRLLERFFYQFKQILSS